MLDEDTARCYSPGIGVGNQLFRHGRCVFRGASEQFLDRVLKDHALRDEVVIATKVYFPMKDGSNTQGLSRKHILDAADANLKRLDTDYIDLYIIHRRDYQTPIEETTEALDSLGPIIFIFWQPLTAHPSAGVAPCDHQLPNQHGQYRK
ncbi:MAG: aldo/keto reductase [Christensenellales bacterium]